jgi:chromosome segregation ATPase
LSPLTKVFVVLHVVLSLLLTAGLIVFVNRTENFKGTLASAVAKENVAEASASAAAADAQAARQAADSAVAQVNTQIKDVQGQLAAAQTQIAGKDANLAQAASAAAMASADSARLTEALKASEDQKTKQADILAQARTDMDALVHKNSDLNGAVSDLTNKLDVANVERKNFSEQVVEQQNQNKKYVQLLQDNGISPNQAAGLRPNGGGAYAINGVIRGVKTVNSIPYATISVGSADNVQKGMQFNVIDRDKHLFLGYLTIESVEPNEATGKLEGPNIADAHTGTEVRTQL